MAGNELTLEGPATIAKAEALHHEIDTLLSESETLHINASAVERADTAIIQLLSSTCTTADNLNIQVEITASDGLRECTDLLGFKQLSERYQ
ncbi:hypothetical protein A3762_01680 [Oleiphilus sp. HI0125]|uniref:STAS domain-containing protein n=1 Tax=Oleiphilus sp. HI0125 TaxID=1822266 RepID=UPI0007C30A2C|nr:STAS domain-containing protein [Oleiphilus sp. HI0125]KZZ55707.1 hypothetical protein A3762_01680 [Oleiphilus sp. HI0125]